MKKNKRKVIFWVVLILVGLALITLADAILEWTRSMGVSNTLLIGVSAVIILLFLILGFRKKIIDLTWGQLGR